MRAHPNFFLYYFVGNKTKGETQNGSFKKTRHVKFSEKRTFLTPCHAHIICFLETQFPFCLITNDLMFDFHSAWRYRISLLLEFLTAERDWKFLLIRMFNNRKCSLDIVGIYSQKHIQNPACQISLRWSFSWKLLSSKTR